MEERDLRITEHIGRYRVSIRAVISQLFFQGGNCDHVIQRLLEEGRIRSYDGLPGGLSYYQLTLQEARRLSVPQHRTFPHRAAGLREALSVLWFSCMTGKKRLRLERKQIGALFGRGRGFGKPHVAEQTDAGNVIYRIYAPGPNSRNDYRLRTLREESLIVLEHQKLAQWALAGAFRFAILVETPGRLERIRKLVDKSAPWPVKIHLELVPGTNELTNRIRALRERKPSHADLGSHPPA